jgi:hypothetical protein
MHNAIPVHRVPRAFLIYLTLGHARTLVTYIAHVDRAWCYLLPTGEWRRVSCVDRACYRFHFASSQHGKNSHVHA